MTSQNVPTASQRVGGDMGHKDIHRLCGRMLSKFEFGDIGLILLVNLAC